MDFNNRALPDHSAAFALLLQEVARFPFTQAHAAMEHFIRGMCDILSASGGSWIGTTIDKDISVVPAMEIINGWFVIDFLNIEIDPWGLSEMEQYALYFQLVKEHGLDTATKYAIEHAGQLRGTIRSDFFEKEEWEQQWHYRDYLSVIGVSEGMIVGFPVDAECESYLTFERALGAPPFTEDEKQFSMMASVAIAHLQRQLMFLAGALMPRLKLFSPQERVVVRRLIEGAREKEIAIELDVAVSTAHNHVSAAYRKLGVSGKAGLMSVLAEV